MSEKVSNKGNLHLLLIFVKKLFIINSSESYNAEIATIKCQTVYVTKYIYKVTNVSQL